MLFSSEGEDATKGQFYSEEERGDLEGRSMMWTNLEGTGAGMDQLVKPGAIQTRVRAPDPARNFSPRLSCQCRLSYGVCTAPVCSRMHQHLCAR